MRNCEHFWTIEYIQPEYERLWWRLEKTAYTYEHPLEIAARLKAEEEAAGGGDDDEGDEE